jgi:YgiT-type zinc finger domain-containing protein
MTQTPTHHVSRCAVCGDELQATTITHEERRGVNISLFQHVPAQVCTACGELWIAEEVLQKLDRLIKEGVPTKKVKTPVYDFRATAAVR